MLLSSRGEQFVSAVIFYWTEWLRLHLHSGANAVCQRLERLAEALLLTAVVAMAEFAFVSVYDLPGVRWSAVIALSRSLQILDLSIEDGISVVPNPFVI